MNHVFEGVSPNIGTQVALVTGGAGFIGSHVVDALLNRGLSVIVIDNLSTGKWDNIAHHSGNHRLMFVQADICDGLFAATYNLERAWKNIDVIVHLAAQTSVVRSVASPLSDARTNYLGTLHVLDYARITGVRRVVFISSSAVYGGVTAMPVEESHRVSPLSPYGVHKLCGEVLIEYCRQAHEMSAIAFRLFNVYGPRQDPSNAYSGVISVFADRALASQPLVIYGDGTQSRDFVFVADVVRAIVNASIAHLECGVFNIGTGTETTINSLARMIIELSGSPSSISHAVARAGELHRSVADISRAMTSLRFQPKLSLRDGLSETLAWFQRDCGSTRQHTRAKYDRDSTADQRVS